MNKIQQYLNKTSILALILIISITAKSFIAFGSPAEFIFLKSTKQSTKISEKKTSNLIFTNFIAEENDNEEEEDHSEDNTLSKDLFFEQTNSNESLAASKKASFLQYYLSFIQKKNTALYLVYCSIKIPTQNSRV
jgi:hypothetical protein